MSTLGKPAGSSLSPRKREILRRVINHYVREIHPVSSASVASEINVSSATVRNELAALEELGFLIQPHTSGGRVPTDLAYRYLVEELINQVSITLAQRGRVAEVYRQLGHETESLLEGTLDLLTEMTGYVAWVSLPEQSALTIRSINFVEVDKHDLLMVLVTGSGAMQSRLFSTDLEIRDLNIGRLTEELNNYLRGKSIVEVDFKRIQQIYEEVVSVKDRLVDTIREFFLALSATSDRLVFGDAVQLVLQPEFAQVGSLNNVLAVIKDKERFIRMLREQLNERQVQTIIGSENIDNSLHDCSLVLSRYQLPHAAGEGTVGILGPRRQSYQRTLPLVKLVGEAVARVLWELTEEQAGD